MARPRSKGCVHCKRQKIKCDEGKPSCDYCLSTGKECQYPPTEMWKPVVPAQVKVTKPKRNPKRKVLTSYASPHTPSDERITYPHSHSLEFSSPAIDFPTIPTPIETRPPPTPNAILTKAMTVRGPDVLSIQYLLSEPIAGHLAPEVESESETISPRIVNVNPTADWALTSPTTILGISPFELRILDFFNEWGFQKWHVSKDPRQRLIWKELIPRYLFQSEVLKISVYAYSGMLMLREYGSKYLLGQAPDDESEKTIYEFSTANFDSLVRKIRLFQKRLQEGTLGDSEAQILLMSQSMMFNILCRNSNNPLPLVGFNGEKDLFSYALSMKSTSKRCFDAMGSDYWSFNELLIENYVELGPMYVELMREFEQPGEWNTDDMSYATLSKSIHILNTQTRAVFTKNSDVPLLRFYHLIDDHWFELVYEKNLFALRILMLYATYSLMSGFYFIRTRNTFVSYIEWYREYNMTKFGRYYFPSDENVYRVTILEQRSFKNRHEESTFNIYEL